MNPMKNAEILNNFKKQLFHLELKILEACSFDYRINNYVHADEFIVKFGKKLGFSYQVCHLAWLIGYDVLKLEIMLIVPQHCISLAVLKIATELIGQDLEIWKKRETFIKLDVQQLQFQEAYFDILNFFINAFELCDLKDNLPVGVPMISIDTFIQLKKRAGPEVGIREMNESSLKADEYFAVQREYTVRERRYTLIQSLVKDESNSLEKMH